MNQVRALDRATLVARDVVQGALRRQAIEQQQRSTQRQPRMMAIAKIKLMDLHK